MPITTEVSKDFIQSEANGSLNLYSEVPTDMSELTDNSFCYTNLKIEKGRHQGGVIRAYKDISSGDAGLELCTISGEDTLTKAITIDSLGVKELNFGERPLPLPWYNTIQSISGGGWTMFKNFPAKRYRTHPPYQQTSELITRRPAGATESHAGGDFRWIEPWIKSATLRTTETPFGSDASGDTHPPSLTTNYNADISGIGADEILFYVIAENGEPMWWIIDFDKFTNITVEKGWGTGVWGYYNDNMIIKNSPNVDHLTRVRCGVGLGWAADKVFVTMAETEINAHQFSTPFYRSEDLTLRSAVSYSESGDTSILCNPQSAQHPLYLTAPLVPDFNDILLYNQGMAIFVRNTSATQEQADRLVAAARPNIPIHITVEDAYLHISAPLSIYTPTQLDEVAVVGLPTTLVADSWQAGSILAGAAIDTDGKWKLVRQTHNAPIASQYAYDNWHFGINHGKPFYNEKALPTDWYYSRNVSAYDYDEVLMYMPMYPYVNSLVDAPAAALAESYPGTGTVLHPDIWQIWDRTTLENLNNSKGGTSGRYCKKSSVSQYPHETWVQVGNASSGSVIRYSTTTTPFNFKPKSGSYSGSIAYDYPEWREEHECTERGDSADCAAAEAGANGNDAYPWSGGKRSYYVRRSDGQPVRLKNKVKIDVDGNLDVDGTITCSRITAQGGENTGNGGMTITDEGNVGIGTTTPDAALHVVAKATIAQYTLLRTVKYGDVAKGPGVYWTDSNYPDTPAIAVPAVSARFNNHIYAQDGFVTASDLRIKTDISLVDDDRALQQVNALESKEYHYIDPYRRRKMKTIGFIAQEVKDIIPNAVSLQKDFTPDEMRIIAEPQWGNQILTILDLDMTTDNLTGKCKFYVSNDQSGNDEQCIKIDCEKDSYGNNINQFKFEQEYTNVFFYGKEVNDFHTIDKNQIFALHHSAIQELSRKNDEKTEKIAELENKNQKLEATVLGLKNEILQIKQHLGI